MKLYIGLKENVKLIIIASEKKLAREHALNKILFMDLLETKRLQKNTLRPEIVV